MGNHSVHNYRPSPCHPSEFLIDSCKKWGGEKVPLGNTDILSGSSLLWPSFSKVGSWLRKSAIAVLTNQDTQQKASPCWNLQRFSDSKLCKLIYWVECVEKKLVRTQINEFKNCFGFYPLVRLLNRHGLRVKLKVTVFVYSEALSPPSLKYAAECTTQWITQEIHPFPL